MSDLNLSAATIAAQAQVVDQRADLSGTPVVPYYEQRKGALTALTPATSEFTSTGGTQSAIDFTAFTRALVQVVMGSATSITLVLTDSPTATGTYTTTVDANGAHAAVTASGSYVVGTLNNFVKAVVTAAGGGGWTVSLTPLP